MRTIEDIKTAISYYEKQQKTVVKNQSFIHTIKELESELRGALIDGIPLDRLEEICNAERAGLCVVLPCKIGDVFYKADWEWSRCTPYDSIFDEYSCCGCECKCDREKVYSVKELKCHRLSELVKYIDDFGKTTFLTREAAEAALKGAGHE